MAVEVYLHGAGPAFAKALQEELAKLGRDDVQIMAVPQQPDPDCTCDICSMRREAQAEGRNPLVHRSLQVIDGCVRDIVRHRIFEDPTGNTIFFDQLYHPVDELNLYTCECERVAQEDFHAKPLFNEDGSARFLTIDCRPEDPPLLDHVRGEVQTFDGRRAEITVIAGPVFDQVMRERCQRAE
jgi:hypothetical protein